MIGVADPTSNPEARVDADMDTLATALYVKTDDALKASPQFAPLRPAVGIDPELSDAELVTLAVMQALPGFTSEARWLRPAAAGPPRGTRRRRFRHVGEGLHFVPGHRAVRASPQTHVTRAQVEHVAVVGVHRQPFAVAATIFIAAELEKYIGPLERLAAVPRTQDGAIGRASVGVR